MLLCSLYRISLPSHFVQFSVCDLCFDGYRSPVSPLSGVCNLVGEVDPEVCALIPSIWALIGLLWPELALDIEGIFPIALWFSLPSLWWYLSLVGGIEPQICFWAVFLICGARLVGLGHTHWERSHWIFLLAKYSPRGVLCVSPFML